MDNELLTIELMPGLTLQIDPTKFEVVGVPISLKVNSQNMAVIFDLSIATAEGGQESQVKNVVRVRTAR